jgi:Outer membrane protein beta-barrel domain
MLGKAIVSMGILSACAVSLQTQDYTQLNFNIGGGVSTPLNPTGQYAGANGNFVVGAGYNIDKNNSILGEFLWNGLPPNRFALRPINALSGSTNLYSLTANYRFQLDSIGGSAAGIYLIGGGGWYYRQTHISKDYIVPAYTVCQPIYFWWGYTCEAGYVPTDNVLASSGSSAGGLNAGTGFTIRLSDTGWKFYVEARYHYAWNKRIPTAVIPVTFGLRFN